MVKPGSHKPLNAWSQSVGDRGATIRVAEDWSKGGAVYLHRTVGRKPVKRSLAEYLGLGEAFSLRNPRGEILRRRQEKAVEVAKACAADLALGLDPFRSGKSTAPRPGARKPTIRDAFDEALRSSNGMFVSDTGHKKDWLRASDHVLAALRSGPGENDYPLCEEIVPGTSQTVWRHLLH